MKCMYIYSTNDRDYRANGESKKVLSQIDAFVDNGIEVKLLDIVLDKKIHKLLYRLPWYGVYSSRFISECKQEVIDSDFVYIRKNIFDTSYLKLLQALKNTNPSVKIFVEIPTFPYFQEWNRVVDKPLIIKEKKIIPRVCEQKLVDYYLTLTDDVTIYGLPTIKFENCVTVQKYSIKKNLQKRNEVHMIGVALVATWHGYDRIVRGLTEYYNANQDKKVYFHIVGDGPELANLKRLVSENVLSSYVIFEGKKSGEELDALYDQAHIGIGSLAPYRMGFPSCNSLKTREYCAKGIPFVMTNDDSLFDNCEFSYGVPNDDTVIDIQDICDFVSTIDYSTISKRMREYAEEKLDWGKFVKDIAEKVL